MFVEVCNSTHFLSLFAPKDVDLLLVVHGAFPLHLLAVQSNHSFDESTRVLIPYENS